MWKIRSGWSAGSGTRGGGVLEFFPFLPAGGGRGGLLLLVFAGVVVVVVVTGSGVVACGAADVVTRDCSVVDEELATVPLPGGGLTWSCGVIKRAL